MKSALRLEFEQLDRIVGEFPLKAEYFNWGYPAPMQEKGTIKIVKTTNDNIDTPLFVSDDGEEVLIDDDDAFAILLVRKHTDQYEPYLQIEIHFVNEDNYDDIVLSTPKMKGCCDYTNEEPERLLRDVLKQDVEILSYNSQHIPACLYDGIDGYMVAVKDFSGNTTLVYCSTKQCYSKCVADNERMHPISVNHSRTGVIFLDIDAGGKHYAKRNYEREIYEVSSDTAS